MAMSAKSKALALLARREHSVHELSAKLAQKGYDADEIAVAIEQMIQAKYLDDDRFIGCMIRYRLSSGSGPNKIKAELLGHDFSSYRIQSHEEWKKANWRLAAFHAKQKRFGSELESDLRLKAKQLQFLTRRGFYLEDANAAISTSDELSFFD